MKDPYVRASHHGYMYAGRVLVRVMLTGFPLLTVSEKTVFQDRSIIPYTDYAWTGWCTSTGVIGNPYSTSTWIVTWA